nr:retrovirus-related Pol polyprotein from transposon TNT 1-94 [Tanacetum cinerariifolium]
MINVSKLISIPNEEFSDDTTPSVPRKFLNEVKSTIVTLQRVVKQKMTLETHNWSSSTHQELHKIVKDEIFPIVNQVDARVQNFEIQFLKEAAKFVGDFKSLAKEADESLAKHKALQLEIERLLRAVVSDQKDTTCGKSANTKFAKQSNLGKPPKDDTIYENAKLRAQSFDKVSDQKDTTCGKSANTKFAKQSNLGKPPKDGKTYALSKPVTSNSILIAQGSKVVKNDKVIQICLWCVDSGCSKHMTGNLKLLIIFIWKFLGTVCLGNDHVAAILGFDDLQWGNILITKVYFVKGLENNLLTIGQFYDSDFEVAFRRNACFIRNLEGVDLLKGDQTTNLYTINLHEMASASPICLMARASSTKSWLWHQLERRNRTLVEAPRTMLIFSRASLFLWAEAIATACFTQNRSIIHRRFNKTPYELINSKKPDISFLHVFRALCYPKNDHEDIGKLCAKGDIGFFIGYSVDSRAYRVYNRRTKKIMETMKVSFDELLAMAFEQRSSKPELQSMTSGQISSGLDLTYAPSTTTTQQPTEGELDLLFEAMYDNYIGGKPSSAQRTISVDQAHQVRQTPTTSTTIADTVLTPTNSSS